MVASPTFTRADWLHMARIAAAEDKGVLELLQEYAQLYGMSPGGQEAAAQALQVEGQE